MFFITVSNGLLEAKHRKKIGSAVWEFMWIIDKITKIDDEGIGWVWGGKPVNLKDIRLGVHPINTSKNLNKLEKAGYIFLTHTPYGIVIKVAKAKKRFSDNAKPQKKRFSDNAERFSDNAKPNKTISIDNLNREDNTNKENNIYIEKNSDKIFTEKDRKELISLFKPLNPNFELLFARKSQAEALRRMVEKFGREKVEKSIQAATISAGQDFAPTITTPIELEIKLGKLIQFFKRQKSRGSMLVKI